MNWEHRIIREDLRPFFRDSAGKSIEAQVQALIAQQQATWPMLRDACAGLEQAEYRHFNVGGSRVIAQCNPRRIVSTAAKVDAATIRQRACFLCPDNLPAEEKGIEFEDDFIILCNPFPVLKNHLVISHRQHTPQAIPGNFQSLLRLTRQLGANWFTLYNGPKCGASAPDHMHFQACDRSLIPIFSELESHPRHYLLQETGLEVFTLTNYRLNVLAARSHSPEKLSAWFDRLLRQLSGNEPAAHKADTLVGKSVAEPMLNLVATADGEEITVLVFPRAKHRPDCYFAEGDQKLTVSPAGIDLAGVLVVPERAHFEKITTADIANIYTEVSLFIL